MAEQGDSFKVLVAVVLVGALIIAFINYGCGKAGDDIPIDEPAPVIR